jgi:CspA family cold shock protein
MATGTVKWFNRTKGFGFITPDDGSEDVFVQIVAVERAGLSSLTEGQRIQFDLKRKARGDSNATNLIPIP